MPRPGNDAATAKNKNRRIRQEALREQLSQQKHIEHVVEILNKLKDESQEVDAAMMGRYRLVIETKLKLANKYIPDLKATEVSGPDGGPIDLKGVSDQELVELVNELIGKS